MNGDVYFILDRFSGGVKIGWSRNVKRRARGLQTSSPNTFKLLGSIPGSKVVEKEIHDHFHSSRIRGEWFRATDDVLEQVRSILEDGWPIP